MAKNYFIPIYGEKIAANPPLFHEQLRYERERRGWSQADLAEKMRCDTKTIGRWESSESLPRPYHRQALAELLEKNLEELGLLQKVVSFQIARKPYPSDVTDAQWGLLAPFIPELRVVSPCEPILRREIVNGILYLLQTGCSWRQMPHDLPNGKMVYHYFRRWKRDGTWKKAIAVLR